ncbi:MAG: hypothetical protein KatS3mg011_2269 [Acidimicrobiia bacterium]|nr:MAG: hypothetical protein KatS3mg011_2269 [Acidimicrobiia bacterium]
MDLEARLRRLEDKEEIRQLVTRYGLVVDEMDLDGIADLFTPDAELCSRDGVFAAKGIEAILDTYRARFEVLGPTYHYVHGQTIDLDPDDPDRARGITTSHAEVVRNGEAMMVAVVYHDEYRRFQGAWRFARREMAFFYYLRPADYAAALPTPWRVRAYDSPHPADYPHRSAQGG